jgi:enoyl-CoA hydratase/carnithine racemase
MGDLHETRADRGRNTFRRALTLLLARSYTPARLLDDAFLAIWPPGPRSVRARQESLPHHTRLTRALAMESTQTKLVVTSVKNGVMTMELTFDPGNCYTHEMMRQIDEAILKARFDNAVHVIVIRGSGEKFFCAGADINMLKTADPTFKYYFCLHANETLNRFEQTPKLVIAALNGHTVNLGVLPGTGGTQRLTRLVNKSKAIELMVTAEVFGFEKALDLGIINEVWDSPDTATFMDRIQTYAESFCPPNKASKAVGRIKRAVQSGAEIPFESALAVERELQQLLFQGEDAKEGIAAYVEKRKGNFTGK